MIIVVAEAVVLLLSLALYCTVGVWEKGLLYLSVRRVTLWGCWSGVWLDYTRLDMARSLGQRLPAAAEHMWPIGCLGCS